MNGAAGVLEAAESVVPAPWGASSSMLRHGVLDLLRGHAQRRAHETALVFALEQGAHAELTWAQLQPLVHAHAAHIAAGGAAPGDTVVVLSSSVAEQVLGFLGAIAAGCVPTIVSYPSSKQSAEAFEAMLRPVLVHSRARLLLHGDSFAPHVGGLAALTTLRPFAAASELPPPHAGVARGADEPLFLQFSSGTTGARKAVAVSERMLLNQAASYAAAIELRAGDKVVSWLPLYHDMGLVAALLIPLCHGVTGIHVSPFEWLTRPEMLFELIERHRATLLWLPNFAYELCAQRIDARCAARLGTLRGIVNCSEPVRARAHERFLDTFGRLGVRPEMLQTCYAMAETTFAVTQSCFGRAASVDRVDREAFLAQGRAVPAAAGAAPGSTLEMVSSGRPIAGTQLRIAGAPGERRVGEIEVRSDSMFGGYLFNGDGADTLGADGWLRTGDLGYLAGGELYVTGRSKDLIIRRGHNIHPTDIEEVVAQVEGCKAGRVVAFGIDDPERGTQDVVVMAERAGGGVDAASLRCAIRERLLTALNETPADVLVCEPNTLRKSTSGKLSRSGNRQLYLGRLAARPAPAATQGAAPAGNALERELQLLWQAALRLPHVPREARLFAELGADSLAAMQVVGEIQRRFGRAIDAGSLLREDTVRRQARLLQSDAPAADGVLVCLQEGAGRTPLFLVHAASGRAWPYRTLLPHLDTERPVYAFQAPELFGTPGFLGVDEMAACYLEKMLELQPRGPYLIGGWSFGGAIAHALACRLVAMGQTVQRLVLFDTDPPTPTLVRWRYRLRQGLLRRAALHGVAAQRLSAARDASACARFLAALRPGTESAAELAALMRFACPGRFDGASAAVPASALWLALRDELAATCRPEETRPFLIAGQDAPMQLHNARVLVKNRRLAVLHTPRQRFPGVIHIVAANDAQRLQGWARHAGEPPRIRAYPVAGTEALAPHFCMFEPHNVALFGADLNVLLNGTAGAA